MKLVIMFFVLGLAVALLMPDKVIDTAYMFTDVVRDKIGGVTNRFWTSIGENFFSKNGGVNGSASIMSGQTVKNDSVSMSSSGDDPVKGFSIPINDSGVSGKDNGSRVVQGYLIVNFYQGLYTNRLFNSSVGRYLLGRGYRHAETDGVVFRDVYYKPINYTWIITVYDWNIVHKYGFSPLYKNLPYLHRYVVNNSSWRFRLDGRKYIVCISITSPSSWYRQKAYYYFTVQKTKTVDIAIKYSVVLVTHTVNGKKSEKLVAKPFPCPYNLIGPLRDTWGHP